MDKEDFWIVEAILTLFLYIVIIFGVILIYKVFKGPTIVDRIVAADSTDILLGVGMVLYGAIEKTSFYIDLGIIIALLGFVGTLLICRYLEGKV